MSALGCAFVTAATAGGATMWPWLVAGVVAAGLALLPRVLSKQALAQRRWERVHRDLAAANGLTAAEAKLVWRLASAAGLENPALVFVRPSLFESRAAMAGIDGDTVRAIRAKLYGG